MLRHLKRYGRPLEYGYRIRISEVNNSRWYLISLNFHSFRDYLHSLSRRVSQVQRRNQHEGGSCNDVRTIFLSLGTISPTEKGFLTLKILHLNLTGEWVARR